MKANVLERYHSQDNYYSEGEGLQNSKWRGKYAEFQGLKGEIQRDNWMNACNGRAPDGTALRRQQRGSRAGWDITLSASKSVSLKALVDQDPEILEAHRKAVESTVQYIEENCIHAQIKRNGEVISEQTQQGHFALFEHDDNRNQDPQLHTHVVVLNQTLCSDGKSRTLDSRELFNQKKTIGAIYDHHLAYELKQQVYRLNWTSDHTFEIDGYAKEQLEEFSTRRQEICEYLERQNISLEQATEEQKTVACLESRAAKVHKLSPVDHEIQHQAWTKLADDLGIEHPQPQQELENLYQSPSHPGSIAEVIESALESATAQQVAVKKQELLRECLRYSQGFYKPRAIARAIELDERLIATNDQRLTSEKILKREHFILKAAERATGG
ncbi:MAG: MobF family relaxase, partial [Cyanobacteria bacterium P01_F01_bin.42]